MDRCVIACSPTNAAQTEECRVPRTVRKLVEVVDPFTARIRCGLPSNISNFYLCIPLNSNSSHFVLHRDIYLSFGLFTCTANPSIHSTFFLDQPSSLLSLSIRLSTDPSIIMLFQAVILPGLCAVAAVASTIPTLKSRQVPSKPCSHTTGGIHVIGIPGEGSADPPYGLLSTTVADILNAIPGSTNISLPYDHSNTNGVQQSDQGVRCAPDIHHPSK